ncbi:hypothetical protein ACE38W_00440 [Chitinophaga sp. Hz27]|uniref:hypothetical protein n=1 Tax=Chitinophaga sp. Hz27 TaxID=3347169 RepID=UPI0035DA03E1
MNINDFIKHYCQCTGEELSPKAAGGPYAYYKRYCVCSGCIHSLPMLSTTGVEPTNFPVTVISVTGEVVGIAQDKAEYITKWNTDINNQALGLLSGTTGLFQFILLAKDCKNLITHVSGNSISTYSRLFEEKFEKVFE